MFVLRVLFLFVVVVFPVFSIPSFCKKLYRTSFDSYTTNGSLRGKTTHLSKINRFIFYQLAVANYVVRT